MKVISVSAYLDGGTIEISTEDKTFCVDRRIRTSTKGGLYLGYPQKDNSNHIPDPDFTLRKALREAIQGFRDPRFDWNCDNALDFAFEPTE